MKYLLLLLPLFSFGQEMPIAIRPVSTWSVSDDVQTQLQLALDSVDNGKYTAQKPSVYGDSLIQLVFSEGDIIYTDYIIGRRSHDTIYTRPAMYACDVTCKNYNECVGGGCYKTAACGCACTGSGSCSEIWLAIFGEAPIGAVIRERILISHNHEIPTE